MVGLQDNGCNGSVQAQTVEKYEKPYYGLTEEGTNAIFYKLGRPHTGGGNNSHG
jgi:hypothetical protein